MGGYVCGGGGGSSLVVVTSLSLVLRFERLPEKELENSKQRERLIYSPL